MTPNLPSIGTVVTLASDVEQRWPMTVTQHVTAEHVECVWLDGDGESNSRWLHVDALRPYVPKRIGLPEP